MSKIIYTCNKCHKVLEAHIDHLCENTIIDPHDPYICKRCGLKMEKINEHWNTLICIPALRKELDKVSAELKDRVNLVRSESK